MINIKFRVKITFGERKKGNEIREQYIEYFKSISNVLHLKKKKFIYLAVHVGSSSLARDQSHPPCVGRAES